MISDEGCIQRSNARSRRGQSGEPLLPVTISTPTKAMQKDLTMNSGEQPLRGLSFSVGAAPDQLEQGEPLERITSKSGGRTASTAVSCLSN